MGHLDADPRSPDPAGSPDRRRARDLAGSPGTPDLVDHLFEREGVRLFVIDHAGSVRTTVGTASVGWAPWSLVSEGSSRPGAPITACAHPNDRITLALADRGSGVFTSTSPTGNEWSTWQPAAQGSVGGAVPHLVLRDPESAVVTEGDGLLSVGVDQRMLAPSLTSSGETRPWTLEIAAPPGIPGQNVPAYAHVVAEHRIDLAEVNDRVAFILGPHGEKISLAGSTHEGKARLRLTVHDRESAALLDFHGILDDLIQGAQDPGVPTHLHEGIAYTVASFDADLGKGLGVDVDQVRVTDLTVTTGPAEHILGQPPGLRVSLGIAGEIVIRLKGFPLATVKVRGGRVDAEVGLRVGSDGEFQTQSWISGDGKLVDIDLHWAAALAAGVIPLVYIGAAAAVEIIESGVNRALVDTVARMAALSSNTIRHRLAVLIGADVTYQSMGLDGSSLQVRYLAMREPQPIPSGTYRPVAGADVTELAGGAWQVGPDARGDTWATPNLATKIDHIVMVMMENRSYDHVLGYLGRGPTGSGDGLSDELLAALGKVGPAPTPLSESNLTPNGAGLKTKFPCGVGHSLADVTEQLSGRLTLPSERVVNHPSGFIANFARRRDGQDAAVRDQVKREDVLGYYQGEDLPFFTHLRQHYAWSDRYFCSHAGPTLPNRMFSLTGDVQYTRSGEAILDNNHGEEFYLSRALTVMDVLNRHGVSWRVYESFPSVTMLRMFARYAGDRQGIRPADTFAADVLAGDLPSFVVVDPAMHHKPLTDDHPVADMYRGQRFLQSVYAALRARPDLWARTLLLITYDEHGGFYDHAVAPVAEILGDGAEAVVTAYGVRVPTFVVSPSVKPGLGPPIVLDHCSILKTVLARFCPESRPFLSDRVQAAATFESFLTADSPRLDVPLPADLAELSESDPIRRIVTEPVFRDQMAAGNVDYHDLTGMLARTMGRGE